MLSAEFPPSLSLALVANIQRHRWRHHLSHLLRIGSRLAPTPRPRRPSRRPSGRTPAAARPPLTAPFEHIIQRGPIPGAAIRRRCCCGSSIAGRSRGRCLDGLTFTDRTQMTALMSNARRAVAAIAVAVQAAAAADANLQRIAERPVAVVAVVLVRRRR